MVVNKINDEINGAPKNISFISLFIPIFHNRIMATTIKRPVPDKTVLLVCDIQVKFGEVFSPTERPESLLTMSYRRGNLWFRRGGRDCQQDAQDSQGNGTSTAVLIGLR